MRFLRNTIYVVINIAFSSKSDETFFAIFKNTKQCERCNIFRYLFLSLVENLPCRVYICTYVRGKVIASQGWKLGAWHTFLELLPSNAAHQDQSLKKKEIFKRQENLEIIRSIASSFNLFQYYYVVEIEWIAFSIAMPL